jgi:hypothetical protein
MSTMPSGSRKIPKKNKEGWWSVRELRRNTLKFPAAPALGRRTADFSWVLVRLAANALPKLGRNRGDRHILLEAESQNGNPG